MRHKDVVKHIDDIVQKSPVEKYIDLQVPKWPLIRHARWLWYWLWLHDQIRLAKIEGKGVDFVTHAEQEKLDAVWAGHA